MVRYTRNVNLTPPYPTRQPPRKDFHTRKDVRRRFRHYPNLQSGQDEFASPCISNLGLKADKRLESADMNGCDQADDAVSTITF